MTSQFSKRIRKVKREISKKSHTSVFAVSSAKQRHLSRDTETLFHQDSDFFYLSGSRIKGVTLLIFSGTRKPLLIAPKPDAKIELWEGKQPSARSLAKDLGAELALTDSVEKIFRNEIRGIDELYYQSTDTLSNKVASDVFSVQSHLRNDLPALFSHTDVVLEKMRLFKDATEVAAIQKAAALTNQAYRETLPLMRSGVKEYQIVASMEYHFRFQNGGIAFPTIAGCGRSAATLHYQSHERTLKNGEMLLIDCGATWDGYAADITRVIPIGGKFSDVQSLIYDGVLAAQEAALSKVRHNVKILDVYNAAAKELCYCLKDLKLLSGNITSLLKKKSYRKWFPHGIGHSLGLDTHDIGRLRGNNEARLEKGMVFTIEPGLYFPENVKSVKACGIRIEDDILVTSKGYKNLSKGFPKDRQDVENLF